MMSNVRQSSHHINFYIDGECVMSDYEYGYPPFNKGDTIWLEECNGGVGGKFQKADPMPLTRYTVKDIHYSVKKHYSDYIITSRTIEVMLRKADG